MLDAAGHELSCASRVKGNILDLVRKTVEDLSVYYYVLGSPVHHHYHLQVVSSETLLSLKK